jgi:SNF2 family DNA or RNA helicase
MELGCAIGVSGSNSGTTKDIANKGILGTKKEFRKRFATNFSRNLETRRSLDSIISEVMLARPSELNAQSLPSKTEMIVFITLSAHQTRLYQDRLNALAAFKGSKFTGSAAAMHSLVAICNHPACDDDRGKVVAALPESLTCWNGDPRCRRAGATHRTRLRNAEGMPDCKAVAPRLEIISESSGKLLFVDGLLHALYTRSDLRRR